MSLQSQLTRMAQNVGALNADTNAIFDALRAKGVYVPADAQLSDVADMIESIVPPHHNEVEIGGRWYPYVQIGNQLWLAENLDYLWTGLTFGGNSYPQNQPNAWYYNNDEPAYGYDGLKYGLLYNYEAIYYLESNKDTLLPSGWRVPTKTDFEVLIDYAGGEDNAGIYLKSTSGWDNDGNGLDTYGFNMKPSGWKASVTSGYSDIGRSGTLSTLTLSGSNDLYVVRMNYHLDKARMIISVYKWDPVFSLRLVKDVT